MTKNALVKQSGEFKVLIDSPTAFQNVSQFLADNGVTFETEENDGVFTIHVTGTLKNAASSDTEN